MPAIVDCSACGRKLRVPDDLLGKLVKCPTCGSTFMASAGGSDPPAGPSAPIPPAQPEPPPQDRTDFMGQGPPPELTERCPYCGEANPREVTRCQFCKEPLPRLGQRAVPAWEEEGGRSRVYRGRRDAEPHRAVLVLVFGIIGIVFAMFCGPVALGFGLAAWVMGGADLRKMREGEMDAEGYGMTMAGYICGIVGTAIGGLVCLCQSLYLLMVILGTMGRRF